MYCSMVPTRIIVCFLHSCFTTTVEELNYYYTVEKGLIDSIKADYDTAIRPWMKTYKTHRFSVYIQSHIYALLDIDEKEETMTTSMGIAMMWFDSRIAWNRAQFENISRIYMQAQNVWRPIWFITNSNDKESVIEFDDWVPIRYLSNGQAIWQQMGTIKTSCEIDITYYPFDTQVCSIKLHWYEYEIISLIHKSDHFEYYVDNGLWDVVDHEIRTNDDEMPSYEIVYTFKRKPDYTIFNILFPVLLIALLGPLVFLLPIEAGERVSYSVTILLTVSVYMTIINEYLPHTSKPMAFLTYELFSLYVFCALIVIVVILTTKIYHYSPKTPVPSCLRGLVHVLGCKKKLKHSFSKVKRRVQQHIRRDRVSEQQENGSCGDVDGQLEHANAHEEEHLTAGDIDDEDTSWQDVANALDRLALYTFYFLKVLFLVACLCVAFGNKDK